MTRIDIEDQAEKDDGYEDSGNITWFWNSFLPWANHVTRVLKALSTLARTENNRGEKKKFFQEGENMRGLDLATLRID